MTMVAEKLNHVPRGDSATELVKDMRSASNVVLLRTAKEIVQEKVANSKLFDQASDERVPKLDIEDLKLGRVVGRGGFCVVHDIKTLGAAMSIDSRSVSSSRFSISRLYGNPFRSRRAPSTAAPSMDTGSDWLSNTGSGRDEPGESYVDTGPAFRSNGNYVVKRLSMENPDKITFLKGAVDLAMEARFLSTLNHINVIKLYGVSSDGPFAEGFFIVLEKMDETLTKRIKKWMDIDRQCKGITGVFAGSKKKIKDLNSERMISAFEIAKGCQHLHNKRIVFRDLKPDNIGYNPNGVLKLFDFGLAKELRDDEKTEDGLYRMTGFTGALRYMAPEVGLERPYNLKVDVYSWAMILWYMLALEPPLGLYTKSMIEERVFRKGYRPKIFKAWSSRIASVMKQAWATDHRERPSMKELTVLMRAELSDINPRFAALMDNSTGF